MNNPNTITNMSREGESRLIIPTQLLNSQQEEQPLLGILVTASWNYDN